MLKGLNSQQVEDLIMSVGTHRGKRRLNPAEVGKLIRLSLLAGSSYEEIGHGLKLGKDQTRRFDSVVDLPDDLQSRITWNRYRGALTLTAAYRIAAVKDVDQQRYLVDAVAELGLTAGEIQTAIQTLKRSDSTVEEAVAGAVALRPQIERIYLFVGELTDGFLIHKLEEMKPFQVNDEIRNAVKEIPSIVPKDIRSISTKLPRYFLTCGEDSATVLNGIKDGFERAVENALQDAS